MKQEIGEKKLLYIWTLEGKFYMEDIGYEGEEITEHLYKALIKYERNRIKILNNKPRPE